MIRRHADLTLYREIFKSKDFIRVALGASLIPMALALDHTHLMLTWAVPPAGLLLIFSILVNGLPIIRDAALGLLKKRINVDELVSIAILACVINGNFLEAAVVSAIMVFGALVEEAVSDSARNAIQSLIEITPETAVVEKNGQEVSLKVSDIQKGDVLVVRPGETICVDGEITGGKTAVDESSITGESIPVGKQPGDGVYAGTLNIDGFVRIKALKLGEDSTIGKIIRMVKAAEQSKTDSAKIVDQYASWFTPVILACAALAYLATRDASRAVTVLIVGCPCSFLLAGPVSTVAAIGRAAKAGILVKGGKYLENIAQASAFYFDKTGTLTLGEPVVVKVIPEAHTTEKEILSLAAGIEKGSLHPLASAILRKARELGCPVPDATDILSDPGTGISGILDHKTIRVETGGQYDPSGYTTVKLTVDDRLYGHICMEDQPRPEAGRVIRKIQGLGIRETAILSGDQEAPVSRIARKVGIPAWYSRQKPEDKLALITSYAGGKLVYIGDGVNDAPGLKASSTGIAMGFKGSDVALETADIVLMNDNLSLLPFLITLSKKMSRIIKLNIGISFAINLISVAAGFAGFLTPMMGAVSHNIGSITVVLLSASIGFSKEN